jgi:outer membrane PBP1 activator LpoA protein
MKTMTAILLAFLLAGCATQTTEKKKLKGRLTPDATRGTMAEPNGQIRQRIQIFQRATGSQ